MFNPYKQLVSDCLEHQAEIKQCSESKTQKCLQPVQSGFSLIEVLVVVLILSLLISLLLPAAQATRGAARRTVCINNLKNQWTAIHSFENVQNCLPTSGRGVILGNKSKGLSFSRNLNSLHSQILPHLKNFGTNETQVDLRKDYLSNNNQNVGVKYVTEFVCPSGRGIFRTINGLAVANYFPTPLVQPSKIISGSKVNLAGGFLELYSNKRSHDVRDGVNNTILLLEDTSFESSSRLLDIEAKSDTPASHLTNEWVSPLNAIYVDATPKKSTSGHANGTFAVLGGGTCKFISHKIDAKIFVALITANSRDVSVSDDWLIEH